jgi:hypothetical protein
VPGTGSTCAEEVLRPVIKRVVPAQPGSVTQPTLVHRNIK